MIYKCVYAYDHLCSCTVLVTLECSSVVRMLGNSNCPNYGTCRRINTPELLHYTYISIAYIHSNPEHLTWEKVVGNVAYPWSNWQYINIIT